MQPFYLIADVSIEPQVVIAILFLLFSGVKWLFDKNKKGDDGESSGLEDIYEQYREEIRKRQTTTQQPSPPQLTAQPQVAAKKPAGTPPPLPATEAVETTMATISAYTEKMTKPRPQLTKAERDALKRVQDQKTVLASKSRKRSSASNMSRYSSMLSSPSSAKDAIVLSEILGPPKALH